MAREDVLRLVDELQVHQIELEMQNEELRQAQAELAQSRDRFNDLYDFAPVGYVTLDEDGTILEANLTAATMLGVERNKLLGHKFTRFVVPGAQDALYLHHRAALADDGKVACDLRLRRKDGTTFSARMETICVRDASTPSRHCRSALLDITERKAAEEALAASHEELEQRVLERTADLRRKDDDLREAQRIASIGNWSWDAATDAVTGSEELLRIFGFDPATPTMPAFREQKGRLYPAATWDRLSAAFQETMKTGSGFELDVKALCDGAPIWVAIHGEVVRNARGRADGLRGTIQDITARKQAEEALGQSESRYRTLFSSLLEAFCIVDVLFNASGRPVDYRFLEVNPAFSKQTGLRGATGRLVTEILPENEAHWFEIYGDIAVTGIPQHFVREAKALKRWYEVSAFRLGGSDSRKVAILFNDITESKRSELALRESEERYRQLMHGLPVAVHTCDKKGRIVLCNAAAVALWGREPDLRRDRWCGASRAFTAEGQPLTPGNCPVAQTVRVGKAIRDRELIIERPDGSQSHVLVFPDPTHDSSGALTGAVVIQVDITALKAAENALRTSERNLQKLSRAVEQSPASVLITSPSGEIDYVNPKFTEVTGYELQEVLGRNPRLLKSGVQPRTVYRDIWETITAGRVWRGELCNRKKNGELFWEFAVIAPIEVQGTITHFIALKEDITERRQAANALREREARLRAIFDQAIVGIAQADLTGRFLAVNERFCRLVGRPEKEILQKRIQDFTHPDDLQRNLKLFKALVAGGPDFEIEKRYVHKDGSEIWVQNRVNAIRDAAGEPQSAVAISIDITQRRQAELQRARLAAIVASSADAMFSKNLDGIVETWNAAAERLYGYTAAEMIGQPVTVIVPPERAREYRHVIQTVKKGQQIIDLETLRRRKDGSEFPISLSASPVRDAAGKIVGTSIIASDITARRQLEAEVLQIAEAERERLAAELHDGACQELTGIQFLANLLRRDLAKASHPLAMQARRIEEAISEATEHTREVARGMNPVVADGDGLMHALRQLAETITTTRRIRCSFECPKPVAIENAIASHELYRIAQEAVHNALRHGRARRITVRLSEVRDEIRLSVRDNGRGLPADVSHAPGMGLRVMKYRAGSIGGQFLVRPRRGGGTEVICRVTRPAIQP